MKWAVLQEDCCPMRRGHKDTGRHRGATTWGHGEAVLVPRRHKPCPYLHLGPLSDLSVSSPERQYVSAV